MVVLEGGRFLMNEVPLYVFVASPTDEIAVNGSLGETQDKMSKGHPPRVVNTTYTKIKIGFVQSCFVSSPFFLPMAASALSLFPPLSLALKMHPQRLMITRGGSGLLWVGL